MPSPPDKDRKACCIIRVTAGSALETVATTKIGYPYDKCGTEIGWPFLHHYKTGPITYYLVIQGTLVVGAQERQPTRKGMPRKCTSSSGVLAQ